MKKVPGSILASPVKTAEVRSIVKTLESHYQSVDSIGFDESVVLTHYKATSLICEV